MADNPFLSIGPLTLTDEQKAAAAAGKIAPWLTIGANGAGGSAPFVPYLNKPAFGLADVINNIGQAGRDFAQPNLDSLPVTNNARKIAGGVVSAVPDLLNWTGNKIAPVIDNSIDAVTMTEREIQDRDRQQAMASGPTISEDTADMQRLSAYNSIFGGLGGEGSMGGGQIIGPADTGGGGGYTLPPPPPGVDYSGVQDAIDQTKPVMDTAGLEEQRKGSILTGLVGGMLSMAMDDDASFGQIMGNAGLGALAGWSKADEGKRAAEETFKKSMDEYWIRTAGVRGDQAESDADFAQRVYDTKIQQMQINNQAAAARAKAGESVLRQAGDKFFVEETIQTPNGPMRQIRPLQMGVIDRMAGMETEATRLLGGTDEAKKKAQAIVAEVASTKDPELALPMITVARLKSSGKYLDFIDKLTKADPAFNKQFSQVGVQLEGASGMSAENINKMAESRRDFMLVDLIMKSDAARQLAYSLAGMDEQRLTGAR